MNLTKPLPLAEGIDSAIQWILGTFGPAISVLAATIGDIDHSLRLILRDVPPLVMVAILGAWVIWRHGARAAAGVVFCGLLIWNLGLWSRATDTLSLVALSTSASLILGIPIGVLCAESRVARAIITPVLDFMQTTPAFVYLIPSVIFLGIGAAPGLFATMMFALPPAARATQLGITQVDPQIAEAGRAFGSTRLQMLLKIKLPLAQPYIFLGINQCIMMSLNVVVIAALVGSGGLGTEVTSALTQLNLSKGIEAGVAIVLVAIILDRAARARTRTKTQTREIEPTMRRSRKVVVHPDG